MHRPLLLSAIVLAASVAPVRADDEAEARAVIAAAAKAHGGADELARFKAAVATIKGTFHGPGAPIEYTGSWSFQAPDQLRVEVESEVACRKYKRIQVIDGDKGWVRANDATAEMTRDQLDEQRESFHAAAVARLTGLDDKAYKLSPLGESKVGDKAAVGVRVEREGRRPVDLYFDKDGSLLLKMETRGKDGDGKEFAAVTLYGNYKKIDGIQTAQKVTIKHDGKTFVESENIEYKRVEKLDAGLFAKP